MVKKDLFENGLVSVRVSKCIIDTVEKVSLPFRFIDSFSDIPSTSDFINNKSRNVFFTNGCMKTGID